MTGVQTGPFRRTDRLLHRQDFTRISQEGRRGATPGFVILVSDSAPDAVCRLGITMSRRVGGSVVRNRLKRRVREWYRSRRSTLVSCDLVVIGRRSAVELSAAEADAMLDLAASRAGALS